MPKKFPTSRSTLKRFWQNARFAVVSNWRVTPVLSSIKIFLYALQGIFPLLIAYLAGKLIDSIVGFLNGSITSQRPIIILLIAATVSGYVFNQTMRLSSYIERLAEIKYEKYITASLLQKFSELDHTYYEDAGFHKELSKINNNIRRILTFGNEIFYLQVSVMQLLATGLALIKLNALAALILVAGILPLLRAQMTSAKERWRFWDKVEHEWRLRDSIRHALLDTRAIGEIKIFQLTGYFRQLWQKYFSRNMKTRIKLENQLEIRQFWAGLTELITQLGIGLWLLLKVLGRSGFSLGNFEFYRRIVNDFSNASSRLVRGLQVVSEAQLYMDDYRNLMALEPKVPIAKKSQKLSGKATPEIELKDVSFKYPGSNRYVLKNINLKINPGEDIAMVGANGAGKTTIIKLLMRFYDPTAGQIFINSIDLRELDLADWYAQVGALFQEFNHYSFFKARKSIGVGNVGELKNQTKVRAAAKEAGADKFIKSLPTGYETVLNRYFKEGTELSGGEWQRIALARAFFRNANILILDEPTAAIDAKGEYEIFKKIANTQKGKTTIIISHRFSTVRNANKIYIIDKGQITEQGSHQELMKIAGGTYKQMFELQAAGYK